jgi:hypothetical protein
MALARVVTFEGVSKERMDQLQHEMSSGDPPEGLETTEMIALHDPAADRALVVLFFDDDDAYRRGDEILNAMDAGDTPGRRTSVTKCNVALRMSP